MFNIRLTPGAVRVSAASHYNSGSMKMMRLLAATAPQHCYCYFGQFKHFDDKGWPEPSKPEPEQYHFSGAGAISRCGSGSSSTLMCNM
jgi:hypothetical protein